MCLSIRFLLTLFLVNLPFLFCSSQNVTLNTQTDVDAFDGSITMINGRLTIETTDMSDPIINLSNLSNLTTIEKDLVIENNPELTNLNGLNSLTAINGDLGTQITVLSIINNSVLENIDGLINLTTVAGGAVIFNNPVLLHLNGLQNINITGGLNIAGNENLVELADFTNVNNIDGRLFIINNSSLINLDGFINLTTISMSLNISDNVALADLDGLANLDCVETSVKIENNSVITNLDGLSNLNCIGDGQSGLIMLSIKDNLNLQNIDGLNGVDTIKGGVWVRKNPALQHINGFNNLNLIEGGLIIDQNPLLTHLDGLRNLNNIQESLWIKNNEGLTNTYGLHKITSLNGSLEILNNNKLKNLNGLINLNFIGDYLKISENSLLSDCCAIKELLATPDSIGGTITIENNPSECSSITDVFTAICTYVAVNAPCDGSNTGSIQVQIPFLLPPLSYSWVRIDDNQTGMGTSTNGYFNINNLPEGTYNLEIIDANGTFYSTENIMLGSFPGSIFEIIELTTTNSSNGFDNGAIHITVAGGTPPYDYSWVGTGLGAAQNIAEVSFSIENLVAGAYDITINDAIGNIQTISVSLLDETTPFFPCTQPLDIVILNDVSGSVDLIEYEESKAFFADFLTVANIGTGAENSRAAIIEWSEAHQQSIRIPMTDDLETLQDYPNNNRAFYYSGTNPHEAMIFGKEYLEDNARPNVERVLILSTDGSEGQISPSLIDLADEFKAEGYHIVTVAFDHAFSDSYTREILQQIASIDLLAPGAPAYSQLGEDLAENIVTIYLCPIDPGSSATAYFNRDGAIDIIGIEAIGNCPNPDYVELTFTIEALRELSIPSGTPVTFYYNNPAMFGATSILTWQVPCAIPAGTTETFTVILPVTTAANIFAIFNDDGQASPPINFPITNIDELAYSNNVADTTICIGSMPTLQAIKYTSTPTPICNDLVIYTINVCNISEMDATEVVITDIPPTGFLLLSTIVNDNNCATNNDGDFDIPAGCCVSQTYTYDASNAANGNYYDQDVDLSGANNQVYLGFDGAPTAAEDVVIDGTVNCPSTVVDFTKEVNVSESCEDAFVVYTFTIDNQLNVPLQGISFSDVLPAPAIWAFQPYNLNGLSIGSTTVSNGNASFIIAEVEANTVATFSFDAYLGNWATDGILENTATLENVLDAENSGLQTLVSNTVSTNVLAKPAIAITIDNNCTTVELSAILDGNENADFAWITTGDGQFSDSSAAVTTYAFGMEDMASDSVVFSVAVATECDEINESITVEFFEAPEPSSLIIDICDNTTTEYNGTTLAIGDTQLFNLEDENGCDSMVTVTVESLPTSEEEIFFEICENQTTDFNGISLAAGEQRDFIFTNEFGCDSTITVTVLAQAITVDMDIPNAFTPNGDGTNDCFKPYLADASNFENYQLFIYNRWGNQVFSTADPAACWDGTFKNEPAAADVYIWRIEVETAECYQVILLKGDVTLIR